MATKSNKKELFNGRKVSGILEFAHSDFIERKLHGSNRLSISGHQIKHSLKLEKNKLMLTDSGGQYILKPLPNSAFLHIAELPANEHINMQIAKQLFGINVAPNAFVLFSEGKPAYITKRFDITETGNKKIVEDFAQILGKTSESDGEDYKYKSSYETIGELIKNNVATSELELEKFFRLVLFNYLISNGDAHLKNFSLVRNQEYGDYLLSPAYDLVCTALHTPNESDMALDLFADDYESESYKAGNKHLAEDFIELGNRLAVAPQNIQKIFQIFTTAATKVPELLSRSYLSPKLQTQYLAHFNDKLTRILPNI